MSPGTYTVVVGTNDSGLDAIYDYTLTVVRIPATFTVPANDEGGTLTNGGNHTGRITIGDLDPWTITTTAPNERLIFNIGELGTSPDASAYPWTGSMVPPARYSTIRGTSLLPRSR